MILGVLTKKNSTLSRLTVFLFFLLFSYLSPATIHASLEPQFVNKSVWLSPTKPEEGKQVIIYSAVYNPSEKPLVGVLEFFDGKVLLGTSSFSVAQNDAHVASINWKPAIGDHLISVRMTKTAFVSGKTTQPIRVSSPQTDALSVSVSKSIISSKDSKSLPSQKVQESNSESADVGVKKRTEFAFVDDIQNKISSLLPLSVKNSLSSIWGTLDSWRESKYNSYESKREYLYKDINIASRSISSEDVVLSPFGYISLFFTTLGTVVFSANSILILSFCIGLFILFRFARFVIKYIKTSHDFN